MAVQFFGSPQEPLFNLPTSSLSPELLDELLGVLAEENHRNTRVSLPTLDAFKSYECASDFFQICERFKLSAEAKYLGLELFDRFLSRHILDLFKYAKQGGYSREQWNTLLRRMYKQLHLRMVSCCQVASKLFSHKKAVTSRQAQNLLGDMGHAYTCESVVQSEIRIMKTVHFKVLLPHPLLYVETLLEIMGYNYSLENVKTIYGVCGELLVLVYLKFEWVYDSLFSALKRREPSNKLERGDFKRFERDLMLRAVAVISCAVYILNRQSSNKVVQDLAQITKIPSDNILDFSSVLIQLVLDEEF